MTYLRLNIDERIWVYRDALKDEDSNYEVKDDSDCSFILSLTHRRAHTLWKHIPTLPA